MCFGTILFCDNEKERGQYFPFFEFSSQVFTDMSISKGTFFTFFPGTPYKEVSHLFFSQCQLKIIRVGTIQKTIDKVYRFLFTHLLYSFAHDLLFGPYFFTCTFY